MLLPDRKTAIDALKTALSIWKIYNANSNKVNLIVVWQNATEKIETAISLDLLSSGALQHRMDPETNRPITSTLGNVKAYEMQIDKAKLATI